MSLKRFHRKGFTMNGRPLFFSLSFALLSITGCAIRQERGPSPKQAACRLEVKIRNITKRILYATCFAYIKKENAPRWHWQKSSVVELMPDKEVIIPIDTFNSPRTVPDAYGVLGVFTNAHEAESAIYELIPDENKIDLDRLKKIQGQTVVLGIEKYGIVGDIFDYSFIPDNTTLQAVPELDFSVDNRTGKTLYVTAFVYQKKENMPIWQYDKSPVIMIADGASGIIDVDTITNTYDRKYTRGYLAVFDETEKKEAYDSTYQLLKAHQSINLGLLSELKDRKVILKSQKYGILGDVIDFVIKAPKKIANTKSENIKEQPRYS